MTSVTSLKRMSGLEINVVLHEIQNSAMGLRVANLYSINKRTYLIKLVGSSRKLFLILESGVRLHLTDYERDVESTPNGLATKMRRYLRGKRLMAVEQLGLDRVVRLQFGIDDSAFNIFVELYGTGNVVFTNHQYEILALLRQQSYGQSLLGHSNDDSKQDQSSGVLLHSKYAWDTSHSLPSRVNSDFVTSLFYAKYERVLADQEELEKAPPPAPSSTSRPVKQQRKKKKTIPTVKDVLYQSIFGPQLSLHGCTQLGIDLNRQYTTVLDDPVYAEQLVQALNLSLKCYQDVVDKKVGYLLCRHSVDNNVSYTFDFTPGSLYQTTIDPQVNVVPLKTSQLPLLSSNIPATSSTSSSSPTAGVVDDVINPTTAADTPSTDTPSTTTATIDDSDPVVASLLSEYIQQPFIDPMSQGKPGPHVPTYHLPVDGWHLFDWDIIPTTTDTPHGKVKEVWFYCQSFSLCVDIYYGSKEVEREQIRIIREKENAASKIEKAKHDHTAKLNVLHDQIHDLSLKAQLIEANSEFVDRSIAAVTAQLDKGRDWDIIHDVISQQKHMLNPIALMIHRLQLADRKMVLTLSWDLEHIQQLIIKAQIERNHQQQLLAQQQQAIQARLNPTIAAGTSDEDEDDDDEDDDEDNDSDDEGVDDSHSPAEGSSDPASKDGVTSRDHDAGYTSHDGGDGNGDDDNDGDSHNDDDDSESDADMMIVDDMDDETLQDAAMDQDDEKEHKRQDNLPGSVNNPISITIDLSKTAFANAQAYYSQSKELARKMNVTETLGLQSVKTIEKRAMKEISNVKESTSRIRRKVMWFEKFHWFITSEGFLVIAGRDAAQNELIVKRYLSSTDLYFHADLNGASSVVLKNTKNLEQVPQLSISQAAAFTVCHSAAWKNKATNVRAYWVHANQVSKTPPTGMYLPQGSFMIRGTKNYVEAQPLVMGVGLLFRCGDIETVERHRGERKIRETQQAEDLKYIEDQRQKAKEEEDERERERRKLQQIEEMHNMQQRQLEEKYYGKVLTDGDHGDNNTTTNNAAGGASSTTSTNNIVDGSSSSTTNAGNAKGKGKPDGVPKKRVLSRKDRYDMKKLGLTVDKYWQRKDEQDAIQEKARLEAEEALRVLKQQQEEEEQRLKQQKEEEERLAREADEKARAEAAAAAKVDGAEDHSGDHDEDDEDDDEIDFDNIDDDDDDDGDEDDDDEDDEDGSTTEQQSSSTLTTPAPSLRHKNTKRGKKRAQQYQLQDEEDLTRIEQLYGIKRSQSKGEHSGSDDDHTQSQRTPEQIREDKNKEYYRQRQQQKEEKFRQREAMLAAKYNGVIPEDVLNDIAADDDLDDADELEKRMMDKEQMDGTEYLLTQLTSKPLPEDVLTHAIPMVGPYAAFGDFTFRVKLVPGGGKKGATIKDSTSTFLRTATEILRGEGVGKLKEIPSLIKQINDSSFSLAMISGAKVSVAGIGQLHRQQKQQKKQAAKQRDANKK